MKYLDGFRNPAAASALRERIHRVAAPLEGRGRRVCIMEVCGSHTMAIGRHGIRDLLPPVVDLVSGPGCPVCVTDAGYVDTAIELAGRGADICTFGDMLNVPGSTTSLAAARAAGATVTICYSPLDALARARADRTREVVFLAIGFETTIAPVISLIDMAREASLDNISLLTAFKLVPPALEALATDPDLRVDGFLCPAHVSAIIGSDAYTAFATHHHRPCVVAGFEPLDILMGIEAILHQLASGEARVENQYSRVVTRQGNRRAQALMARLLQPADADWRGLGRVPASGLALRPEFERFDAERRFGLTVGRGREPAGCRCGDVIKGKIRPPDCPLFGKACTPSRAIGPCMVSSEGSCAAWFKYSRTAQDPR